MGEPRPKLAHYLAAIAAGLVAAILVWLLSPDSSFIAAVLPALVSIGVLAGSVGKPSRAIPVVEENSLVPTPFQPALSAAGVGAWIWNTKSGEFQCTDDVQKILDRNDIDSIDSVEIFKECIFRDDRQAFDLAVEGVLNGSRRSPLDCRFVRSDRSLVWVEITMCLVVTSSRNAKIAGAMTDITERKNVESQLDKGSSYLEAIIESTDNVVFSIDRQYRLTVFNRRFLTDMRSSFGATLHVGDNLVECVSQDLVELWKTRFDSVFEGESLRIEDAFDIRGRRYIYDVSIKPIHENGYVTGAAVYSRNITKQKQREKDLRHAKERAVESDRLKSAFLANMSHEIRTPLNAVMGFAQLLKSESVTEEENARFLDVILSNGNHLLKILGDIIDLAQIESGQLSVEPVPCDLTLLMAETQSAFFDRITSLEGCSINLVMENSLQAADYIVCDQTRLKQIVYNLVSNATKFTLDGSIRVGYQKLSNGMVEFSVADTGSGISSEMKKRVFQRFLQGETKASRANDGVGLGLSICEGLVRLLGGDIWIEDNEPRGSVFKFTIRDHSDVMPLPEVESSTVDLGQTIEPRGSDSRQKILIAEDDDTNYLVIEEFLRLEKLESVRAVNGREALDIAQEDESIGLVVMDLSMPIMDGLEATRRIKKIRPDLPVIAHTAHAMRAELNKAIEAGCSDCLVKPISIESFRAIVGRYI